MSDPAISVKGLRKTYGELEAVAGIDLEVAYGEIFALLGPNGAGKTTAVEILEGYRQRSAGEVSVLGFDPEQRQRGFKEKIGIVLQETGVEPYLTVEEALQLFGSYYPHPRRVNEALALTGLSDQRSVRVIKLSGGQKRRLDVAIGLIGDPDLLFLDEPTTGFDPAARRNAWEMVRGLRDLGKTVLLTTHYMDEAEHLADRVAIIRRGEIVASGSPGSLINLDEGATIRFRWRDDMQFLLQGVAGWSLSDGFVSLHSATPTALLNSLTGRAMEAGIELAELSVSRLTLEDIYLRLVAEAQPA